MTLLLAAAALCVPQHPQKQRRDAPAHTISAARDFGDPAAPTDEWKHGMAIHNKLRSEIVMPGDSLPSKVNIDEYLEIIKLFRHQVTNRVLAIGDKVGADVNAVLAFEECASKCDETYEMGVPR